MFVNHLCEARVTTMARLREPLENFASTKYTVGLNGFVEFEMLSEPHVAAGDSIQIDAYEPEDEDDHDNHPKKPGRDCV